MVIDEVAMERAGSVGRRRTFEGASAGWPAASGDGRRDLVGRTVRERRGPRPEEVSLMSRLLDGPAPVTEGPIGRCCKRGWCRALVERVEGGTRLAGSARFELTEAGRAIVLAVGN